MATPLPCLCDTKPNLIQDGDTYRCICPNCFNESDTFTTPTETILAWNALIERDAPLYPLCDRCGEPTYPNAVCPPDSPLTYCEICASELFD